MAARRLGGVLVGVLLAGLLVACGEGARGPEVARGGPSGSTSAGEVAMPDPGELEDPLLSPDVLVLSQESLPDSVVERIRAVKGVTDIELFSMGQFFAEEQPVRYAAVNPATFRRYTPDGTASTTNLWERIAGGEIMVRPDLGKKVPTTNDFLKIGNGRDAARIHIGALADLSPQLDAPYLDAVVNSRWAGRLGMPKDNALLVSTGMTSPQSIQKRLIRIAGQKASVQILGPKVDISVAQQAVLTASPVASAVGTFSYTVNADGTVNPDPAWIREYIRTEEVPILGSVTCNKAMLLQLRAALRDVVAAGLGGKINPGEFGGCYVPRFIARDPARGLSFHTWGTAVDLNVPGNQRGTVGLIDRRIVQIFNRWGFNWGGLWHYTDPMHFELARIVRAE